MAKDTMKLEMGTVTLHEAGESKGGKRIFKAELPVGNNGDKLYVTLYATGASEPKPIAAQLEAARQENEALKKKANGKVYDSSKRAVVKTSDGGKGGRTDSNVEMREQLAMAMQMIQSLAAKVG